MPLVQLGEAERLCDDAPFVKRDRESKESGKLAKADSMLTDPENRHSRHAQLLLERRSTASDTRNPQDPAAFFEGSDNNPFF